MVWFVGIIGFVLFVAINALVLNPPEMLLKWVLEDKNDKEKKDDKES